MGRHASSATKSPTRRQPALLGWGAFLALLLVVLAPMMGMTLIGGIALGGTSLFVFAVLWFLSGTWSGKSV
ncbi:hypothetical protein [Paeniglutamicibacter cryotolerans]|uniref:Uncharacterized protein n=1 Tax=Paeniglutamicibacter cryotolerans TaxID=670079 RepID=A0A839QRB4_9MICC|nr:hypothetical protein [Paeniglutamicibacter cryotolerans]MBB2997324.1 hypothetical protein [Paeniglutamicibacter cryotolerans]